MGLVRQWAIVLCVSVSYVVATDFRYDGGFNRPQCLQRTLDLLSNGTIAPDDEVFFRDASGHPMFNLQNITLTYPGCMAICGPKQAWYTDIGPRLSTWLIPILLLLSNVELSPLDKRRFLTLIHLLGDPIDSIWSFLHKIDSWDRCCLLAERYTDYCEHCQRIIAAVFAGFEEVERPQILSSKYFKILAREHGLDTKFQIWRQTAVRLADSRTDELARTCFSIILYIFQLVSNFVSVIGGGNSSLPGGRIATGVFLCWLVPATLLSNIIGSFTSRRTGYDIISDFATQTGKPLRATHWQDKSILLTSNPDVDHTYLTGYFSSLPWHGGISSFRPFKFTSSPWERFSSRTRLVAFMATLPVVLSMIGASVCLWYSPPIGFNCRHFWVVGISTFWILSAIATWLAYSTKLVTGIYHWHFVLIKDTVVAIPSVTVFFLSASGLFNNCYCWSGYLHYGATARVLLNTDPYYTVRDRTFYPSVVGICIALQLLCFAGMAFIWRRGLRAWRWKDVVRAREWHAVKSHAVCGCRVGVAR